MTPDTRLTPYRLHLHPHESLLLYTDGITEACDANGSQFGEQRLAHALTSAPRRPTAQDVIGALTQAVNAFTAGQGIDDDQAVLVLTATSPHEGLSRP
ncbi:PP2C family protein-serine/threonine phosphatase [Streptomyces sp. NPDC060000]|uniref:PP2C family protein-serine/threonine phosphatase n=1 Tax=Streptomyces sp. NPDC060000 TaxID=3347031 RepID=UPI0036BA6FBB